MLSPAAVALRPAIDAAVEEVVRSLSPDIVHIRFDIDEDWSGDPAVHFRVLLSDEASRRLREVTSEVRCQLTEQVYLLADGYLPYFNFRNVSEQASRKERVWE